MVISKKGPGGRDQKSQRDGDFGDRKPRRGPKTIASLVRNGVWSMTEASAAERLADVLAAETHASPQTASWQPMCGGSQSLTKSSAVENRLIRQVDSHRLLRRWLSEMSYAGVAVEPVVDILMRGESLSRTDSAYGRRKGWARTQLLASIRVLMKVERHPARENQS